MQRRASSPWFLVFADHEVNGANSERMHLSISEKREHQDVNAMGGQEW